VARGPQIRVSVSQALKDYVEETADRLNYPSAAEFVREALLFRIALILIQEHSGDVAEAEQLCRRLLGEYPPPAA
jgi:Arc/MetJ-type ribon-helix-helix transcriptional regulator